MSFEETVKYFLSSINLTNFQLNEQNEHFIKFICSHLLPMKSLFETSFIYHNDQYEILISNKQFLDENFNKIVLIESNEKIKLEYLEFKIEIREREKEIPKEICSQEVRLESIKNAEEIIHKKFLYQNKVQKKVEKILSASSSLNGALGLNIIEYLNLKELNEPIKFNFSFDGSLIRVSITNSNEGKKVVLNDGYYEFFYDRFRLKINY